MEYVEQVLANIQKLEVFDRYVFDALVDYVIIGERLADGGTDPHKITFVFKVGLNPTPPDPQKTHFFYSDISYRIDRGNLSELSVDKFLYSFCSLTHLDKKS
jgi:hypothetical protein